MPYRYPSMSDGMAICFTRPPDSTTCVLMISVMESYVFISSFAIPSSKPSSVTFTMQYLPSTGIRQVHGDGSTTFQRGPTLCLGYRDHQVQRACEGGHGEEGDHPGGIRLRATRKGGDGEPVDAAGCVEVDGGHQDSGIELEGVPPGKHLEVVRVDEKAAQSYGSVAAHGRVPLVVEVQDRKVRLAGTDELRVANNQRAVHTLMPARLQHDALAEAVVLLTAPPSVLQEHPLQFREPAQDDARCLASGMHVNTSGRPQGGVAAEGLIEIHAHKID
ncbi:hypothetical protein SLS62_002694 [Diatrype stigma]|uniref:Uncharacterized protein n=1 Tax=Diatrype stigma TaxID=117547 RepID=A0AAN9V5Z4_9PEZI